MGAAGTCWLLWCAWSVSRVSNELGAAGALSLSCFGCCSLLVSLGGTSLLALDQHERQNCCNTFTIVTRGQHQRVPTGSSQTQPVTNFRQTHTTGNLLTPLTTQQLDTTDNPTSRPKTLDLVLNHTSTAQGVTYHMLLTTQPQKVALQRPDSTMKRGRSEGFVFATSALALNAAGNSNKN